MCACFTDGFGAMKLILNLTMRVFAMRKWDRFFLFSWCLSLVCFLFTITGEIHWRIGGRNKIEVAYIHDFSIIVYV